VIAVLIFVTTGADAFDVHPEWKAEGEVAIGWSLTSNGNDRLGRFRKRISMTPNAMATAIPPMTPPAIAGPFDLREDAEDDAEWEDNAVEASVEEGEGDVGVETTKSGLKRK
jgi:hypothetical protein